jgi:hypothetical protein
MRQYFKALCAVALVACSDAKAPTAAPSATIPVVPLDTAVNSPTVATDSTAPLNRVEAMMSAGLTKVSLPADQFSLSSDAVHPDMACPPEPWNAEKCWLMYTPYRNSDSYYENPAFLYAASDTAWQTPSGVLNPIIPTPGIGKYNSDPDHAFDPATHRLVQMYRVVADSFNNIMMMSTGDAKEWTPPRLAFRERNHDAVSPALVISGDRSARVWYVRSGEEGCQSRSTTVQMRTAHPAEGEPFEGTTWSAPVRVNLNIPNAVVWHLDVAEVPGGYVALIAAFPVGGACGASDLWLATSVDGLTWRTYGIPVLWRGMKYSTDHEMNTWYRGTLRYDVTSDSLHLWPSAMTAGHWTIYHTAVRLADLRNQLELARAGDWNAAANKMLARRTMLRIFEMP